MTAQPLVLTHDSPDAFLPMPPGLEGYWWETSTFVCVPFVLSHDARAFIGFLNDLERKAKFVFFPTIINARLDRLLRLRGYQDAVAPDQCKGKCTCGAMGETVFGLAKLP